jgi:hypothetical protein
MARLMPSPCKLCDAPLLLLDSPLPPFPRYSTYQASVAYLSDWIEVAGLHEDPRILQELERDGRVHFSALQSAL